MEKIRDYQIVYVEKKDSPILPRVLLFLGILYVLWILSAITDSVM